jgi:hypothetical protein
MDLRKRQGPGPAWTGFSALDHVIGQMLNEARHCQALDMTRCNVSGGPAQYPSVTVAQAAGAEFARHLHAEGFPVTNIATDRWGSKLTLTVLLPAHESSGRSTPGPAGGGKGGRTNMLGKTFHSRSQGAATDAWSGTPRRGLRRCVA